MIPIAGSQSLDPSRRISCADPLMAGEMAGYDTVLFAVGRTPVTASLNLASAGVETTKGGHVVVDKLSRANADG